jgi:hypothetical protein
MDQLRRKSHQGGREGQKHGGLKVKIKKDGGGGRNGWWKGRGICINRP